MLAEFMVWTPLDAYILALLTAWEDYPPLISLHFSLKGGEEWDLSALGN